MLSQIKKNYLYNIVYQIILVLFPIITVPYISRTIGASGVGIYSYTYSIVYYFMLASLLGINNYGNRTIAKARDDKALLSKTFFSIYVIQFFMTAMMIILYILYVFIFNNQYFNIALIQIIYLISVFFDINWFFFGLEKFKVTVVRSSILRLLSLVLIFLLVKSSNDVWLYTLIMASSALFSQLLLLSFLRKEIMLVRIKPKDIFVHIKPILILFVPVVAVSLYKIMDKIMLGSMSNVVEVGYYDQAEKIITIPTGFVTALGTVMLPRISNLASKGETDKILDYIKKSVNFMMFLAFPICFGLIVVSKDFVPIFLGSEFTKSSILIYYLATTVLFVSFANIIRTQYLIPKEKDKVYVISVIVGAVINLVVNVLLIPKYTSIGACIGTICAELFVMLYQVIAVRKELPILDYLRIILIYFVKGLIMFIGCMSIKYIDLSPVLTVLIQVLVGIVIYSLLNINYIKKLLPKKVII